MADSKDGARGFAKPALVASDQAPSGLDPSGFDPAREQSIYNKYGCCTPDMRRQLGLSALENQIREALICARVFGYDPDQVAMQIINSASLVLAEMRIRTAMEMRRRDRDAALRRREAAEAEGQQPGPERSEGIAQLPEDTPKQERG